jgi:hypothetical protein
LVQKLTNSKINHYIYNLEQKFNGFVKNKAICDIVLKGIKKKRHIPPKNVHKIIYKDDTWKVRSQDIGLNNGHEVKNI